MDEYDLILDAIAAVRLVRNHFAGLHASTRVDDVVTMLRGAANRVPAGGHVRVPNELALAVADAIAATYGNGRIHP